MNQYISRSFQIYNLILLITALYFFDPVVFFLTLFIGWILQGISLEILIHRKYAHNLFRYKNLFWEFISYILLISTGLGRPYEWAYGHRVHHRYTDQPNDPQSPHSIGKLKTFFSIFPPGAVGWEGIDNDLKSDSRLMWFNRNYYFLYILYNFIWFSIDPMLAIYFISIPSMLGWLSLGIINVFSHLEKYNVKDLPFPIWFWGGNYHKTHHNDPSKLNLGLNDISYYVIKIIGIPNEK